jgi:hypothetical protein
MAGAVRWPLAARLWLSDASGFAGFYDQLRKQVGLRRAGVELGLLAATVGERRPACWSGWRRRPSDEPGLVPAHPHLRDRALPLHLPRGPRRSGHGDHPRGRPRLPPRAHLAARARRRRRRSDRGPISPTPAASTWASPAGRSCASTCAPSSPALLRHVLYHETSHVLAATAWRAPRAAGRASASSPRGWPSTWPTSSSPSPRSASTPAGWPPWPAPRYQLPRRGPDEPRAPSWPATTSSCSTRWGRSGVAGPRSRPAARSCRRALVATFADPTLPRSLAGLELWRAALQRHHCDPRIG